MISPDVALAEGVVIHHPDLVNLYGCTIGSGTRIGTFVEIQKNAVIGRNCKISSHSFICEGVTLEDGVFIGHGVMFTNDPHPRAVNLDGSLQTDSDWSGRSDPGEAPRLDRQQRHDPGRRDHRRGRAGGRRRRRDAGRSGLRDCCRRAGQDCRSRQGCARRSGDAQVRASGGVR